MLYYALDRLPHTMPLAGLYVQSTSDRQVPKIRPLDTPRKQKTGLFDRLMHHLNRSIMTARTTLNAADFSCKYLLVQTGLELAAEQFLIRQYHPVWNKEEKVCAGFGKHGDRSEPDEETPPGDAETEPATDTTEVATAAPKVGGRKEKSRWDILHPGRPWAETQVSRRGITPERVISDIQGHFLRHALRGPGPVGTYLQPRLDRKATEVAGDGGWIIEANGRATASASFTGTAFPNCLMLSVQDPSKVQSSGKVWSLAHSRHGEVTHGCHPPSEGCSPRPEHRDPLPSMPLLVHRRDSPYALGSFSHQGSRSDSQTLVQTCPPHAMCGRSLMASLTVRQG